MFNPWTQPNPTDIYSMWSKAWGANTPQASPVYAQMHELGNVFRSIFETMQAQSQQPFNPLQLEQMVRQFTINPILPNFPSPMMQTSQNPWQQFFDPNRTWSDPGTSMKQPPALGIGREYQEDWTEYLKLQREYDTALREFLEIFQKFTSSAAERFVESLSDIDENTGFEDVCRQWIDCCDSEFLKVAVTPEYCTAYGNLINAYLRLLHHSSKMQEQFSTMMGQPTRTELDDLHLKNRQAKTEIEELNQKVQDLEKRLQRSQTNKRKQPSRKAATTKKAGTRKNTRGSG